MVSGHKPKTNEIDVEIPERPSNELCIRVERDAHDDTYYQITKGTYIVAERMNDLDDVMMFIRAKLKKMG